MIKDHHTEFAKAVVALAREHKMDRIDCTFQENFSLMHQGNDFIPSQRVNLNWEEGRHGAKTAIKLSAQTTTQERKEI